MNWRPFLLVGTVSLVAGLFAQEKPAADSVAVRATARSYERIFKALDKNGGGYALEAPRQNFLKDALADDDMCMATPALAGDRPLIRTAARLYCLRKTK